MTPAEMRELLLEEARWWANQPAHSGTAQRWVTFFEQLPEDDQMLVGLSGGFEDPDAFAFRKRADLGAPPFSVWNMFCNILQKLSKEPAIPRRPKRMPATLRRYTPPSKLRDKP